MFFTKKKGLCDFIIGWVNVKIILWLLMLIWESRQLKRIMSSTLIFIQWGMLRELPSIFKKWQNRLVIYSVSITVCASRKYDVIHGIPWKILECIMTNIKRLMSWELLSLLTLWGLFVSGLKLIPAGFHKVFEIPLELNGQKVISLLIMVLSCRLQNWHLFIIVIMFITKPRTHQKQEFSKNYLCDRISEKCTRCITISLCE